MKLQSPKNLVINKTLKIKKVTYKEHLCRVNQLCPICVTLPGDLEMRVFPTDSIEAPPLASAFIVANNLCM
jgi:hypothetical protein